MCCASVWKLSRNTLSLVTVTIIIFFHIYTRGTAMSVWLSFQQTFSSCNTLHETACFHRWSICQKNHFQGHSGSHQSKHYSVVLHTGCSIPRDTCSHYKYPIFQTALCQGRQSVKNNSAHILDPCFSCSTLNGTPKNKSDKNNYFYCEFSQ